MPRREPVPIEEQDREDAQRRADEVKNEAEAVNVYWRGEFAGLMNASDIFVDCSEPEWHVASLGNVDRFIEGAGGGE